MMALMSRFTANGWQSVYRRDKWRNPVEIFCLINNESTWWPKRVPRMALESSSFTKTFSSHAFSVTVGLCMSWLEVENQSRWSYRRRDFVWTSSCQAVTYRLEFVIFLCSTYGIRHTEPSYKIEADCHWVSVDSTVEICCNHFVWPLESLSSVVLRLGPRLRYIIIIFYWFNRSSVHVLVVRLLCLLVFFSLPSTLKGISFVQSKWIDFLSYSLS